MFNAQTLVTDAYYIAGIKSRRANETVNATDLATGFDIFNQILDSLSLTAWFSSFLYTLTVNNPTQTLYIGQNLTPVTDVTIIDEEPFKLLFSAGYVTSASDGIQYQLIIKTLSDQANEFITSSAGTPNYLYWANQLQGDNIFTNIKLYPQPTQPSILTIFGIKIMAQFQSQTDNILPTFFNYLKYMVARELASQNGTLKLYLERGNDTQLKNFESLLKQASPIDGQMNDLSSLLERNYYSGYTR